VSAPHLYLVPENLSAARREELRRLAPQAEVVTLTESNGREVLEKIFAAGPVAVWGESEVRP
jgi:hypothetical protein